ncbi:ABC transport system, periplasmic component [Klebsiella variicola]|uniref:ABC transport system, periplasmic component n=1 Tax=Klebsiella variicola TaxID=244366 RepID=A0A7H4MMM5_KLEVA|nr:ABC transport system, periplasmic component [Klebsiella variicola]
MRKTTGTLLATLLLAASGGSALAAEVTVMISGGFKAALEKLAPAWEKQTGNHLVVIPGRRWGKRRRRSLTAWRGANTRTW